MISLQKKKKKENHHTFPLVAYEIGMNVNITVQKSLSLKLSFQINSKYKRSASTELICSNPYFLLQPIAKKNISSTFSNFFDWGLATGKWNNNISYLSTLWDSTWSYPCRGRSKSTEVTWKSSCSLKWDWAIYGCRLEVISHPPWCGGPAKKRRREQSHWHISLPADMLINTSTRGELNQL